MPEGIEFLGHQGGHKGVNPLLFIGGGAILLVLFLKSRGSSAAPLPLPLAAAPSAGGNEVSNLANQNSSDLYALNAGNLIEQLRIQSQERLQMANTPQALKTCIPWVQWWRLTAGEMNQITAQVANGKAILTPSGEGMCVVPTGTGIRGSEPLVTTNEKVGVFASRKSISGPAGSYNVNSGPVAEPAIGGIVKGYLDTSLAAAHAGILY